MSLKDKKKISKINTINYGGNTVLCAKIKRKNTILTNIL